MTLSTSLLANTEYRVEIDNCHSDIENEGTGGVISVEFWSNSKKIVTKTRNGIGVNCLTADAVFSATLSQNITHIIIKTNTGDAFFIDELRLFKNGKLDKHYGSDDGQGWCLSTEANDAFTAWKGKVVNNVCRSSWQFDYTKSTAVVANGIRYGSKISLKSHHGKYLVAEHNGNLNANRDFARSLEHFTIINASNQSDRGYVKFGDKVFLKGGQGKYVVGEHDGTAKANRERAASLETFYILNPKNQNARNVINVKTEKVCFKTLHNKYLVAEPSGVANADRSRASIWESFAINAPETPQTTPTTQTNKYRVDIDNCHSSINDEGTGGTITVEFWQGNAKLATKSKTGIPINCSVDTKFEADIPNGKNVTHVKVKTNTGDAFYIDEIRLFKNNQLKAQYGSEDGTGWCLSSDAGDANGEWKKYIANSTCGSSWTFDYNKAAPTPKTLVLKRVTCLRPATGIERDINETIGFAAETAGMVLKRVPNRGGKAGMVLMGTKIGLELVGLGTTITSLVDAKRSPDNLYILVNGRKAWPSSDYVDVKGGQSKDVNLTLGKGYGTYSVELKEYDWGSGDDSFGVLSIPYDKNTASEFPVLYENAKEDSSYILWFILK